MPIKTNIDMNSINMEDFSMKIRTKLTVYTLIVVMIILAASMSTIYINYKSEAEKTSLDLALTTAREYSSQAEKIFNELVYIAKDIDVFIKTDLEKNKEIKAEQINHILQNLLKTHQNINSIGIFANPDYNGTFDFKYEDDGIKNQLVTKDGKSLSAMLKTEDKVYPVKEVFSMNKAVLFEAATYNVDGNDTKLISLFYPITVDNQTALLIRVDLPVSVLQKMTESITVFDSGFARILSHEGIVVTHKNPKRVGDLAGELKKKKNAKVVENVKQALTNGTEYNAFSYSASTKSEVFKSLTPINILDIDTPWSFGTIVTKKDMYKSVDKLTKIILIAVILSIIAIVIAMIFLSRIITIPIEKATQHAITVSELDFTQKLPEKLVGKKDEIGNMLQAFEKLQFNIKGIVENIYDSSHEVTNSSDELQNITNEFSQATEEISKVVSELEISANEQADNTNDGTSKAQQLEQSIEIVNEKISDMKETVNKVYTIIENGNKTVHELIEINEKNNNAASAVYKGIHDTNESVANISASSEQIAQIADQTNLLALNAAIESARAGEAGRGFAVVAEEIRKLAEESGKLTNEINSAIENLRTQSKNSVESIEIVTKTNQTQKESVQLTRERFESIQSETKEIYDAIDVLLNASGDVNDKKDEIIGILNNLSELATKNAISSEKTSVLTQEQTNSLSNVENQTISLNNQAKNLDKEISKFKF